MSLPEPPRLVIMWSPPRCRSTAFLRMMHERGDFTIVHEPFSHLMDFGVSEIAGTTYEDERAVMDALLALADRTRVFVKDTTDFHYPGVLTAEDFLRAATHTFIVRDPREAVESHHRLNPELTRDEIGFAWVREIYEAVHRVAPSPVVIDAGDLVDRPEDTVRAYCEAVGIAFRPEALEWSPTMLPGWERTGRWHSEVAASRGIARGHGGAPPPGVDERPALQTPDIEDDPVLGPLVRYHLPHYRWLRERRLPPRPVRSAAT